MHTQILFAPRAAWRAVLLCALVALATLSATAAVYVNRVWYYPEGQAPYYNIENITRWSSTTWPDSPDNTYIVEAWYTVESGATLTIPAGAIVKFMPLGTYLQGNLWMQNGARLVAEGTAGAPITFTSGKASPAAGDWSALYFQPGSSGSLNHCVLEYAGNFSSTAIDIQSPNVVITNTRIDRVVGIGIHVTSANATDTRIEGVQITNCTGEAIYQSGGFQQNPMYRNLTATGNGDNAIRVYGSSFSSATTVTDGGLPYVPDGWVAVAAGASLTFEPGVRVEFPVMGTACQGAITVNAGGTLSALGTATERIVFTSHKAEKAPGDWAFIRTEAGSTANFSYCEFAYGGQWGIGALQLDSNTATVEHSTVHHSSNDGISVYGDNRSPHITDVVVADCGQDGISFRTTGGSPVINGADLLDNARNAVYQDTAVMTPSYAGLTRAGNGFDGTFIALNYAITGAVTWGRNAGPYAVSGWQIIADGGHLTVEPGVEVRFAPVGAAMQGCIEVQSGGRLTANGTSARPIIFTSAKAAPAAGDWAYIDFQAGSHGSLLYTRVFYGGQWGSGALRIGATDVVVRHGVVNDSSANGLYLYNAGTAATVETTVFWRCAEAAVYLHVLGMSPVLRGLSSYDCGTNGVLIPGGHPGGAPGGVATLSNAGLPYVVTSWVSVYSGQTLNIEPGARLEFAPMGSAMQGIIHVYTGGTLNAIGTPDKRIVFTPSGLTPAAGGWAGLYFEAGTTGTLDYCDLLYGGQWHSGIVTTHASITIRHSQVAHSLRCGVWVGGGASPVLTNNAFLDCPNDGVYNYTPTEGTADARGSWWGDSSGPYHYTLNPSGLGTAVTDGVTFMSGWLASSPMGGVTGVWVNFTPGATVVAGAPLSVYATSTGGYEQEYRILKRKSTEGAYSELLGWGTAGGVNTWAPVAGTYSLFIQARERGTTRFITSAPRTLVVARPITGLALVASPASPSAVGKRVVLTGAVTGGTAVEYRFAVVNTVGGATTYSREFNTNRSTWWTPTEAGTYTVTVAARERGLTAETTASQTYVVNPVLASVALGMSSPLAGPTAVGVPIVLLATPTGGGTLEYQFLWNLSATTSLAPSWTKLPYGAGRGYTHTPTQPGYYTFRVYAREKGSTASFDRSSTDLKVKVNVPIADFAVKVTPLGSGIFAIAPDAVIGAGGAPQWKFWAKRNGVGSFTLLRDYAAGASFDTWQPTAGTYTVMVYMKEAGSKAASYDLSHSTTVVVP